jgi:hypothetical protein
MRRRYHKRVSFPFHAVGSQGGKSNLNPKASAFTTSRSDTSSTPTSYSNAVTRNTGKGMSVFSIFFLKKYTDLTFSLFQPSG